MGLTESVTPTLSEAAHLAWYARAQIDESAAVNSFAHQLWTKLRISRNDVEIDTGAFSNESVPHLRVGAGVDGLRLCLDKDRTLSVVSWKCAANGCERLKRTQVKDLVTLGKALADGDILSARFPLCDKHQSDADYAERFAELNTKKK